MLLGIQILGICFGLFMIYYSFLHFKRKEFTNKEFAFWLVLWVLLVYVALFPNALDFIVLKLSISRTMDFLILVGFMVLTALFFYVYTLIRQNQKKIEEIVRKIAIKNIKER
jgi:hypothetical protein